LAKVGRTTVGNRIRAYGGCRSRFKELVGLLDSRSVPTSARSAYDKWMRQGT
jgi:hypothetical protein